MTMPVAFMNIGFPELVIVLVIVLLLFGAKRLPDLAKSLGKSIGEFKKGKEDAERETDASLKSKPKDGAGDAK